MRLTLVTFLLFGICAGCSRSRPVTRIRQSLRSAGYTDVNVADDSGKGVVTLTGHVLSDADREKVGSLARAMADPEVVSNQISVQPRGYEKESRAIDSDIDKGIGDNLDAALIRQNLRHGVSYAVKNGVVTLTGDVTSQANRMQVQSIAAAVPYVRQVVNELQVKDQKASSSN